MVCNVYNENFQMKIKDWLRALTVMYETTNSAEFGAYISAINPCLAGCLVICIACVLVPRIKRNFYLTGPMRNKTRQNILMNMLHDETRFCQNSMIWLWTRFTYHLKKTNSLLAYIHYWFYNYMRVQQTGVDLMCWNRRRPHFRLFVLETTCILKQ